MLVKGATVAQLWMAADAVGVRVELGNGKGRYTRFTLSLAPDKKYQRTSGSGFHAGRKVNAVCFHGHYDFMAELFKLAPDAVLTSGLNGNVRYNGVGDFNAFADSTGDRNIGSQVYPVAYRDACLCGGDQR